MAFSENKREVCRALSTGQSHALLVTSLFFPSEEITQHSHFSDVDGGGLPLFLKFCHRTSQPHSCSWLLISWWYGFYMFLSHRVEQTFNIFSKVRGCGGKTHLGATWGSVREGN